MNYPSPLPVSYSPYCNIYWTSKKQQKKDVSYIVKSYITLPNNLIWKSMADRIANKVYILGSYVTEAQPINSARIHRLIVGTNPLLHNRSESHPEVFTVIQGYLLK